ncbi:sensor histidine kinase [Catenovulum adriaticum]|uniref:histidine kinase n=1 Tax=Catenovulum adriaticum TaxID=2984846 RepID=A0ABY7AQG1_9ALTE|nr:HAMP domain-containing sensor histidine kinase [Catenovulum sp. TS8]WAJ70906.1 HAMP domain-containing histidine kinase [Catenovulum sp. TS8]
MQLNWKQIKKYHALTLVRLIFSFSCLLVFWVFSITAFESYLVVGLYCLSHAYLTIKNTSFSLLLSHFVDLIGFSILLYLHGSAMNGAISILYIPIVSASLLLKWRHAWLISMLAIAFYSGLIWQVTSGTHHHMMGAHLQGMWFTFVLSAVAMTWFMSAQRSRLIRQSHEISELKEQQMRDEQILAVATYSANTAHQLSTPLSTLGMLIDELSLFNKESEIPADLQHQLSEQVSFCQTIVKNIAKQAKLNTPNRCQAKQFVEKITQFWWNRRNEIELNTQFELSLDNVEIMTDLNLEMAISNLLDNAADSSLARQSNQIELSSKVEQDKLIIQIQDYGDGFDLQRMANLGLKSTSEKASGMGIGLILANAAIERSQGEIVLVNNERGALTIINLPLLSNTIG